MQDTVGVCLSLGLTAPAVKRGEGENKQTIKAGLLGGLLLLASCVIWYHKVL